MWSPVVARRIHLDSRSWTAHQARLCDSVRIRTFGQTNRDHGLRYRPVLDGQARYTAPVLQGSDAERRPVLNGSSRRGPPPRHSAQALIEFALILPVMLVMVLGGIDLGRALIYGVAVQNGAREAARLGATAAFDSSVTDTTVLQRLIDASGTGARIVPDMSAGHLTSAQTCAGNQWNFTISIVTASHGTFSNIAAARADSQFGGSKLTVTATGGVSMLAGFGPAGA